LQVRRDNGEPILVASASGNQITLNYATDRFDGNAHRFISIGGLESNQVVSRNVRNLILEKPLRLNHPAGTPIFKIQAITYSIGMSVGKMNLLRNENTGGGNQPVAENIENLRFEYFDGENNPTDIPENICLVKVTVTAKTDRSDSDFKGGDGFRRRTIASNIYVRNMDTIQ